MPSDDQPQQTLVYDKAEVDAQIASLPNSVVLKALNVFINSFPELAILHLPTFMNESRSVRSPESKALLGAVLAVTRAQLSVLTVSWAGELLTREQYALYTKEMLSGFILQPPKIQVVQALLIITLHEWGSRDFHKAWIYCGKFALSASSWLPEGDSRLIRFSRNRHPHHAGPPQPARRPLSPRSHV